MSLMSQITIKYQVFRNVVKFSLTYYIYSQYKNSWDKMFQNRQGEFVDAVGSLPKSLYQLLCFRLCLTQKCLEGYLIPLGLACWSE